MHKFTEGLGHATFAGSGVTRVEKADRRAGRFSGPSVFGTWAVESYPFRWQIEYVRRSIAAPGLPQAFAVPPAGVRIFSDGPADFAELPHEIRTLHLGEVCKVCVQLGLPDRSDRMAGTRARESDRGSGRVRSRSRARAVRVASESAVACSGSVESRDGAPPAEATSTASGAPAVVAGPVVPEGSVSVRARVVPEVHAGVRALLEEDAAEDRALLEEAARAGF